MNEWEARDGHPRNCTQAAIDDFPVGVFTREQLEKGGIIIHCCVSLYLFVSLAVVCEKYFVPAVDKICHALKMSNDVAGATFMAAATSAPELFVNVIGTFITEGDIGVGTIVGSAVFNILAVAACCGIGAGMVVPLDWWPLTRDCVAYGFTVSVLICIIHDERVEWYEALTLVMLYGVYIAIMLFDKPLQRCVRGSAKHFRKLVSKKEDHPYDANDAETIESKMPLQAIKVPSSPERQQHNGSVKNCAVATLPRCSGDTALEKASEGNTEVAGVAEAARDGAGAGETGEGDVEAVVIELDEYTHSLWTWPSNRSCLTKTAWIITWPIHLVFLFTIPDCEKERFKRWFPLTFLMCIVWIGSLSYIVAWMITIIGDTLKIPDSVMGITFLAAGTSVPEAVSSVIVAKQGHGSMGISNSIGSNTFDILLCLGLPWLIKSAFIPTIPKQYSVEINSSGLEYSAISLLSTLLMLYIAFYFNKFKLDKAVGVACLCMYGVFLILATLIELNVFFPVNKPTCGV